MVALITRHCSFIRVRIHNQIYFIPSLDESNEHKDEFGNQLLYLIMLEAQRVMVVQGKVERIIRVINQERISIGCT